MTTGFPTSLDVFVNPTATDQQNSVTVPHATQHANINDAVAALQAKVGVNSSAVSTSLDYKVGLLDMFTNLKQSLVLVTGAVTLSSSAYGRLHFLSGTTADYTVDMPAVSGNSGKILGVLCSDALTKMAILDGNGTEKINNALTRPMHNGELAILYCDGTEHKKIGGITIPMVCCVRPSSNQSISHQTATVVNVDTADIDTSGMANLANERIDIKRTSNYAILSAILYAAGNEGTLVDWYRNQARININGTNDGIAEVGINTNDDCRPYAILSTARALTSGDYVTMGAWHSNSGSAAKNVIYEAPANYSRLLVTELPTW